MSAIQQNHEVPRTMLGGQDQQQQQQQNWYSYQSRPLPPPPTLPQQMWAPPHQDQSMQYSQTHVYQHQPPEFYPQSQQPPQQYQHQHQHQPQQHQHPSQHGQFYAQQDQAWPSSNGWNNHQYKYDGGAFNHEEDWAAKARAWAAAKTAQDSQVQGQSLPVGGQPHTQSTSTMPPSSFNQLPMPPPPQPSTYSHEYSGAFNQVNSSGYLQDSTPAGESTLTTYAENPSSVPTQVGVSHAHVVSNSYSHDAPSSYRQEVPISGTEHHKRHGLSDHGYMQTSQVQPQVDQQIYPEPGSRPSYEQQPYDFQQLEGPPSNYTPSVAPGSMDNPESKFSGPIQTWSHMGGPGMTFPTGVAPGVPLNQSLLPQYDQNQPPMPHVQPLHGSQPSPLFCRPHIPPPGPGFRPRGSALGGPFGFGASPAMGPGPGAGMGAAFMGDGNGNLLPERPKKAAVPSWLREELIKKRAVTSVGGGGSIADDSIHTNVVEPIYNASNLHDRAERDSPGGSDAADEDEDEIEAARLSAINQEIKRVLTEVLLKVTDGLFDEIAQEVLDESSEIHEKKSHAEEANEYGHNASLHSSPPPSQTVPSARVLLASKLEANEDNQSGVSASSTGNVLGLASYASDDEEGDQTNASKKDRIGDKQDFNAADMLVDSSMEQHRDMAKNSMNSELFSKELRRAEDGEAKEKESLRKEKERQREKEGNKKESKEFKTRRHHVDVDTHEEASRARHSAISKSDEQNDHGAKYSKDHLAKNRKETDKPYTKMSASSIVEREAYEPNNRKDKLEPLKTDEKHEQPSTTSKNKVDEAVFNNKSGGKHGEVQKDDRSYFLPHKSQNLGTVEKHEKHKDRESVRNISKESGKDAPKGKPDVMLDKLRSKKRGEPEQIKHHSSEKNKKDNKERSEKRVRDKHRELQEPKRGRRNSSSASSRGRSCSRSTSIDGRNSSVSPDKNDNLRRRRQGERSRRRRSISRSPVKTRRRRSSRSRSRSRSRPPRSKHTHRRHSPSLSREKDRYKRDRPQSPARARR